MIEKEEFAVDIYKKKIDLKHKTISQKDQLKIWMKKKRKKKFLKIIKKEFMQVKSKNMMKNKNSTKK